MPIYAGIKHPERYIPVGCFIDFKQFASIEDCYQFIKNMDDNTYQGYVRCIEDWLASDAKNAFMPERHATDVIRALSLPKKAKRDWSAWCYLAVAAFFFRAGSGVRRIVRMLTGRKTK